MAVTCAHIDCYPAEAALRAHLHLSFHLSLLPSCDSKLLLVVPEVSRPSFDGSFLHVTSTPWISRDSWCAGDILALNALGFQPVIGAAPMTIFPEHLRWQ